MSLIRCLTFKKGGSGTGRPISVETRLDRVTLLLTEELTVQHDHATVRQTLTLPVRPTKFCGF